MRYPTEQGATMNTPIIRTQPTPHRLRTDALLHNDNSLLNVSTALNLNVTGASIIDTSLTSVPDGEVVTVPEDVPESAVIVGGQNEVHLSHPPVPQNDEQENVMFVQFRQFLDDSRLLIDNLVEQRVNAHMNEFKTNVFDDMQKKLTDSALVITQLNDEIKELKARLEIETENRGRISNVEKTCVQLTEGLDGTNQQGRKEMIEVHNIPYSYDLHGNEDTTTMMVHFCRNRLGLNVTRRDISVSHRQDHPDERRKVGKNYIPPIYCKFVSRNLAHRCLEQKWKIRGLKNNYGLPIFLRENLTQHRRELWNRVQSELLSYPIQWVKNGKIFVKKFSSSRSITVLTDETLNKLLAQQRPNAPRRQGPSSPPRSPRERASQEIPSSPRRQTPAPPNRRRRWPRTQLRDMNSRRQSHLTPRPPVWRRPGAQLIDFFPSNFNQSQTSNYYYSAPTSYSAAVRQ